MQTNVRLPEKFKVIPEINSGQVLVEEHGYISKERLIKSMIKAGQRLELLRFLGFYDIPVGQDPDNFDIQNNPIRNRGFDLVDVSSYLREIQEKIDSAREEKKKSEIAKKAKELNEKGITVEDLREAKRNQSEPSGEVSEGINLVVPEKG